MPMGRLSKETPVLLDARMRSWACLPIPSVWAMCNPTRNSSLEEPFPAEQAAASKI